jgi:LacI family transcriptional regulator, galactose operon repressor
VDAGRGFGYLGSPELIANRDAITCGGRGSTLGAVPPTCGHLTVLAVARRQVGRNSYFTGRCQSGTLRVVKALSRAEPPRRSPARTGGSTPGNAGVQDRTGRTVTIYQVAQRAGVSIATVSRVLRGTAIVAPETRRRVDEAIADLRFTPSRLGRGLAERQHAADGIVFPDLSGPYYAEVVLGYESVTAELGRSMIILSTHGRERVREQVLDLAARVDGLVIFGRTVDDELVRHIMETGPPVVLLARPPLDGADAVNAENINAAGELTEHLLGHGYRTVTFLGDPDASTDFLERWQGLAAALASAGMPAPTRMTCGFDEQSGYDTGKRLLAPREHARPHCTAASAAGTRAPSGAKQENPPSRSADGADGSGRPGRRMPDVLVCGNDQIALGAMEAAGDLGLRVPHDVAITGWDDVMAARYASLTTVRQPMRALGARAAHALDERISGDRTEPRHDLPPTQLVIRASCGHHPQEATQ